MRRLAGLLVLLCLLAVPAVAKISTTFANAEHPVDGVIVHSGEKITKSWNCIVDKNSDALRNVYVRSVPIVWKKGKEGLKTPDKPTLIRDTKRKGGVLPGETFTVEIEITVPKNLEPGPYEVDVRLCDKAGNILTDEKKKPLYALFEVQQE